MRIKRISFQINMLLTVLLLWNIHLIDATIITSISKMEMLALSEKEMFSVYQTFIRETDDNDGVDDIRRYQDEIKVGDIYEASGDFMENPINAFHFIKRMHDVWGSIISKLECENCLPHPPGPLLEPVNKSQPELTSPEELQRRLQEIDLRYGKTMRVSSDDLRYAALAIVRLWQTYKLDLSALLRGKILDEVTSPLTSDEVYYICNQLDDDRYFYNAIVWLRELQKKMKYSPGDYTENELTRVARALASTYAKAGMPWKSVDILEKEIVGKNDGVNLKKIKRDITYFTQKTADIAVSERNKTLTRDERDLNKAHYEALCRGAIPRKRKVKSQLRCIHRPTKVPYYRVKEEIISYRPRLSMFYEVITDEEISYIKGIAEAKLAESLVSGNVPGGTTNFHYRISQTAWFRNNEDYIFEKISKRVELITGLSTKQTPLPYDGEDLQVLNYGVGGMYEPHEDYFGYPIHLMPTPPDHIYELQGAGDREATWMFYLSDVKAGGSTVFTDINVTVPPVKGAAAFWYDIKRNGELDDQTTHAGCPVLLGSKWVANKWIRQRGQMFRRPCGLYPFSIDIPLPS